MQNNPTAGTFCVGIHPTRLQPHPPVLFTTQSGSVSESQASKSYLPPGSPAVSHPASLHISLWAVTSLVPLSSPRDGPSPPNFPPS